MADSDKPQKSEPRTVSLRSLDGASLEGLHGIKHVVEVEIRALQHELAEVEERIREKEALKAKIEEDRKRNG